MNITTKKSKARKPTSETQEELFSLRPLHAASALAVFAQAPVVPYEDEDVLIDDDIGTRIGEPWKVILYNDDIHTFDEVILQLQKATSCSVQRAEKIAFEAHTRGKAVAFSGEFDECFRVAGVLREIQLVVEIEG